MEETHARLLWFRNNLTMTRIMLLALVTWFFGLLLLFIDGFTIDSAEAITILIGIFSLILALSVQVARQGQQLADMKEHMGDDILELKGWVQQLVQKRD